MPLYLSVDNGSVFEANGRDTLHLYPSPCPVGLVQTLEREIRSVRGDDLRLSDFAENLEGHRMSLGMPDQRLQSRLSSQRTESASSFVALSVLLLILSMNRRHRRTLEAIFEVQASLHWRDIEAMLVALDCELVEGRGSRVAVFFSSGRRAVFHRPHPRTQTGRGAVRALREILRTEGIQP